MKDARLPDADTRTVFPSFSPYIVMEFSEFAELSPPKEL